VTLKKISVQWRPGSEKNPLFQLKDDVGNETLIGAEEVARLMSEVGKKAKAKCFPITSRRKLKGIAKRFDAFRISDRAQSVC